MTDAPSTPPSPDRFSDGFTAASVPVAIATIGDTVEIRNAIGRVLALWPIAGMRVIDENALNGAMVFALADAEGARLTLHPSPARDALLAASRSLRHWRRHRGLGELRTVGIWSAIMIAIVAAGYFGWRPLAGAIAAAVPSAWEEQLGETVRAALVDETKTCRHGDGVAALEALAARLAPETLDGAPIAIDVIRQGQPNALALPGNRIVVFEGLIAEADSPEMLAGVLAHEIAHLDLDHPTRRLIEHLGLGIVVSVAFGGSDIGNAGLVLASFSYSREAEAEADARGIELLERAGIRSDGMARFFRKIEADMPLDPPAWLSTHPDLEARAEANPGLATGDSGLNPDAWQAVRSVCDRAGNDAEAEPASAE